MTWSLRSFQRSTRALGSSDPTSCVYVARFIYDGDGRRVKRVDNNGAVHYAGPHYERNASKGVDTSDTVTKYYYAQLGAQRRLIALNKGGTLTYVHTDHLGGTSMVSGASGTEVGDIRYNSFGSTRVQTGTIPTDKRYTGQTLDASTGLYDYGARPYDPALGRFTQPDTIMPNPAKPQSLNRYSYCLNNPLKYTDPTGHFTEEQLKDYGIPDSQIVAWKGDKVWWGMISKAELGDRLSVETEAGRAEGTFVLQGKATGLVLRQSEGGSDYDSEVDVWRHQGLDSLKRVEPLACFEGDAWPGSSTVWEAPPERRQPQRAPDGVCWTYGGDGKAPGRPRIKVIHYEYIPNLWDLAYVTLEVISVASAFVGGWKTGVVPVNLAQGPAELWIDANNLQNSQRIAVPVARYVR